MYTTLTAAALRKSIGLPDDYVVDGLLASGTCDLYTHNHHLPSFMQALDTLGVETTVKRITSEHIGHAFEFIVAGKRYWFGLDFAATARHREAAHKNYVAENARAMHQANQLIGKPDLVITDYEPVCAQYAYAFGAPLVTIDQQSKYLSGEFPKVLAGTGFADEVMRLRMFFPLADCRIACSFFTVPQRAGGMDVTIVPPVLRHELVRSKAKRQPNPKSILVYQSAQSGFTQSLAQIMPILGHKKGYTFHVFAPASQNLPLKQPANVIFYAHGAREFGPILRDCAGIISTAGHTLLSEAMYLGIPVYALPLALYEQQMNAEVLQQHGFGLKADTITAANLDTFLASMPDFAQHIEHDTTVLLRTNGFPIISSLITARL
ncbi:MAG TPA: glycosyltransferase family protein [Candidatus Saccharimonadales bacterium]|nr:glycosyltransferase family protein [Candidatus Saccharimonadales bacterium]